MSLFQQLLFDTDRHIQRLPKDCVLYISLQVDSLLSPEEVRLSWTDACGALSPDLNVVLQVETSGLDVVDNWLDKHSDSAAALLIISVQLNPFETPIKESAEAAVSILLANEPASEDCLIRLHRPERFDESRDIETSISQALLWAKEEPDHIKTLWMSGLDSEGKKIGLWMQALEHLELKEIQKAERKNIDRIIGKYGLASP